MSRMLLELPFADRLLVSEASDRPMAHRVRMACLRVGDEVCVQYSIVHMYNQQTSVSSC